MDEQITQSTEEVSVDVSQSSQPVKRLVDVIPEEFKGVKSLKSFMEKSVEEALPEILQSYVNAQSLVGKKVGEYTEAELRAAVDLPVKPKEVTEYKESLKGKGFDDEMIEASAPMMMELGLDTGQAEKFLEKSKQQFDDFKSMKEAAVNSLHDEFGLNFRKNMSLAKEAAKVLGGEDLMKKVFDGDSLDPDLVKALAKAGKGMVANAPDVNSAAPKLRTSDEVDAEIQQIIRAPDYAKKRFSDPSLQPKIDALYVEWHELKSKGM